jgi:beta-glucosidase
MPTSVVVCATFNPELARDVGRVIGEEAAENEIDMILATALNIHRNPLNGRHAEIFLGGSLSGRCHGRVLRLRVFTMQVFLTVLSMWPVITVKPHVSATTHWLVKRALREIYLRAFEVLLDHVKPDTIMTGYNAVNGCMCGSDPVLIEGIFREELGFDGFAMTDWNSYDTVDMVEAVNAGISWLTPGENDGSRVDVLLKAVEKGKIKRARLEENTRRVFAVMLRRMEERV